ncbi:SpoIVB peptidase S55 domain-containing protein [Romboutsia sp.]|uniref:SpoIVB peptidase S55 domain-containing protein n=1 Tax=Romboutsia sp. TaxID=1965302 RepID=UPI003F2F4CA4
MVRKKVKYKNSFKLNFILFSCFLFLLYFFSNSSIYAQSNNKKDADYLIPIGNILQIDAELKYLVVRNYVENSPFMLGDALISLNDIPINNYGDFSKVTSSLSDKANVSTLIRRGSRELTIITTKTIIEQVNFNSLLSGFATLTYINPANLEFGAVGHPISIGCFRKIPISNGCISTTSDLNIQKSFRGNVGCINAKRKDTIGQFTENNNFGINGKISGFDISYLPKYKVASLDEVKLGRAQIILQTTSSKYEKFDIKIIAIEKQKNPSQKTFKINIIDKNLLAKTGGIVQGMSGTPIVQGNKIIGAISHAVENDPTLGYGVFIQWMLVD